MARLKEVRFSIVIPCYNEADYIAATLDSLKAQDTSVDYEVIIVDNNSTDKTVEICKTYDVSVVSEARPGVCWARQAGTEAANGEIVVSTDADTTFSPKWLSNLDSSFRNNEEAIAVGGPCRYVSGPWWGKFYTHFLFTGSYLYYLAAGHPFYITATNIAFKKSAWEGYDLCSMQGGDELGLLHSLRRRGRVHFSNSNPTYTSGRRLTKGLAYNVFVTFLFYYLGAYYVNKIFKRSIIGAAPAFRKSGSTGIFPKFSYRFASLVLVLFVVLMAVAPIRGFVADNAHDAASALRDEMKDLA